MFRLKKKNVKDDIITRQLENLDSSGFYMNDNVFLEKENVLEKLVYWKVVNKSQIPVCICYYWD